MIRTPALALACCLLASCAVNKAANRAHIAEFTETSEVERIKAPIVADGVQFRIELVRGCDDSKKPKEADNCVWHAGYSRDGRFMEGYSRILNGEPNRFLMDSSLAFVKAGGEKPVLIRIKVEKLLLKTWLKNDKDYKSCMTRFRYVEEGAETEVEKTVKLPDSETSMEERGLIEYRPKADNVVLLAVSANLKQYLADRGYIKP